MPPRGWLALAVACNPEKGMRGRRDYATHAMTLVHQLERKDMRIKPTLSRRLAGAALALVSGAALAVGAAMPASAETMNGSCENGEVCMYYSTNFSGAVADMYDNNADYSAWHFAGSSSWLNDNTWSGKSKSVWTFACVSEHSNYGGKMFWRGEVTDGGNSDFGTWRDKASSHRFLTSCAYN